MKQHTVDLKEQRQHDETMDYDEDSNYKKVVMDVEDNTLRHSKRRAVISEEQRQDDETMNNDEDSNCKRRVAMDFEDNTLLRHTKNPFQDVNINNLSAFIHKNASLLNTMTPHQRSSVRKRATIQDLPTAMMVLTDEFCDDPMYTHTLLPTFIQASDMINVTQHHDFLSYFDDTEKERYPRQ